MKEELTVIQKECSRLRMQVQGPLSIRSLASSTTPPAAASMSREEPAKKGFIRQLLASPAGFPIAIIGGFILFACSIGVHTAKQQIFHSPSVQVNKAKRECMPEVDYPDAVVKSAGNFRNKSHLRKVGQIQERDYITATRVNPITPSRKCETLKTIGVPTQED